MTTEIVLVDCDDYHALFINGELHDWNDSYSFTFEYGFNIAKAHPNSTIRKEEVDMDWLWDDADGDMPDKLSDVKLL
jgi:hypothetical protein